MEFVCISDSQCSSPEFSNSPQRVPQILDEMFLKIVTFTVQ